jgi:hypothetical protein
MLEPTPYADVRSVSAYAGCSGAQVEYVTYLCESVHQAAGDVPGALFVFYELFTLSTKRTFVLLLTEPSDKNLKNTPRREWSLWSPPVLKTTVLSSWKMPAVLTYVFPPTQTETAVLANVYRSMNGTN